MGCSLFSPLNWFMFSMTPSSISPFKINISQGRWKLIHSFLFCFFILMQPDLTLAICNCQCQMYGDNNISLFSKDVCIALNNASEVFDYVV